jgi:hypothetical protein
MRWSISLASVLLLILGWLFGISPFRNVTGRASSPIDSASVVNTARSGLLPEIKKTSAAVNPTENLQLRRGSPLHSAVQDEANSLPRVEEVVREMKSIIENWISYRERIYESFGLTNLEISDLAAVRAKFDASFDDLATKLANAPAEEISDLALALAFEGRKYDRAIEKIIGKERFQILNHGLDDYKVGVGEIGAVRPSLTHSW